LRRKALEANLTRSSILVAALLVLGFAPTSRAGDAPAAETTTARAKGPGVVKLDIAEAIDDKPSHDSLATYRIRKALREAGYVVWTEKPLAIDEMERRKREKEAKEAKEAGAPTPTASAEDQKPAPDLVVRGRVDVHRSHTSTFFNANVAFIYRGEAELKILDPQGKQVGTVNETDEWGKTEEKPARDECTKRIASWTAAAVLKSQPVYSRLSDKSKAEADKYIANIEQKKGDRKP
jgi:hypothetical protein